MINEKIGAVDESHLNSINQDEFNQSIGDTLSIS